MATIQKSAFRQLPVYPACHNQIINLDNRADHRNAQNREQLSQYRAAQNTDHYAKQDLGDKLDHQDKYEQHKYEAKPLPEQPADNRQLRRIASTDFTGTCSTTALSSMRRKIHRASRRGRGCTNG